MYFTQKSKQKECDMVSFCKYFIWTIVFISIPLFAQYVDYSYDRGLPEQCANCGTQPGADTISVCVTFEKLVFQNADIRVIYALLADTAAMNIVVDPEVNIKATLKLDNVSWCQVFSLLLDLYNLRAVRKEGYLYILAESKYWSEKFGEIENVTKEKQLLDTETWLFRIQNVSADLMQESIADAISSRGNIVVDAQTNTLIVTDLPEQLKIISDMIDSLDILNNQVKISCQIVQIDQSSLKELGINWSASEVGGNVKDVSANMNQVGGVGAGGAMGNFTWGIISGSYQFDVRLSAIISEGKGKILDQPHIITMDNISAEIFSGKQIPINTVDQAGNLVTTFYSIGTKLNVKPRIAKDDKIVMELLIERSGYIIGASGYEITTRTATTTLQVGSNDIAVIGGMITNEQQETEYGVPVLMDIPLLGELFKYTNKTVTSTVITIFITPEILKN